MVSKLVAVWITRCAAIQMDRRGYGYRLVGTGIGSRRSVRDHWHNGYCRQDSFEESFKTCRHTQSQATSAWFVSAESQCVNTIACKHITSNAVIVHHSDSCYDRIGCVDAQKVNR